MNKTVQTVWLEGVPEEHITKISVKLQLERLIETHSDLFKLQPLVFRELVEVTVKQKGSEDVTVSLFEGENGPQVFAIDMLQQSSCQNIKKSLREQYFVQVGKATAKAGDVVTIKLKNPRLWTPDHPFLYKMQVMTNFLQCLSIPRRLNSVLEMRSTLILGFGLFNWPRKETSRSYFSMENL